MTSKDEVRETLDYFIEYLSPGAREIFVSEVRKIMSRNSFVNEFYKTIIKD